MKMFKQYELWHSQLNPLKQFLVSFALNWIYWLVAWVILDKYFIHENLSAPKHIFHATGMSLCMTSFWRGISKVVKSTKNISKEK